MTAFKWIEKKSHFEWMQICLACWQSCELCISESIKTGQFLSCCNICRDCTEICSLCIKFEAQQSIFFEHLCNICADICDSCATECNKFADQSQACKDCAEACKACAEACRETIKKRKQFSPVNA